MKTKIGFFTIFLAIALTGQFVKSENADRPCGTDMKKLWLDVVILVDNSVGMTQDGITQVAAHIATVFGQGTAIGTLYNSNGDSRSTRISLITYNRDATVVADLDKYQSYEDLLNGVFEEVKISTVKDSFIDEGITAAEKVLTDGRRNNYRSNYKRIVMIYASTYTDEGDHDPVFSADRLKADGVKILTGGTGELLQKLSELASPGFGFSNTATWLVGEVQNALLQTNCFCPDLWVQYRQNFQDEESVKYGSCIYPAALQAAWMPAKFACQNMAKNGHLVNEDSQRKHDFIFEAVQNGSNIQPPYIYHIGLSFSNGQWVWEQPSGNPARPLNNSIWNPSFPISPSTANAVLNQQNGEVMETGWQNVNSYTVSKNYVCEVLACDTDNYCA